MSVSFASFARVAPATFVAALAFSTAGCGPVTGEPIALPMPDGEEFAEKVYPVLLRDCAFSTCHGDPARFFRVYGPGRTRLLPDTLPYDPATEQEIQHSYDRARSMVVEGSGALESLLLRKPLPGYSGGSEHKGTDRLGRNVFHSNQDPDYQVLEHWVLSTQDEGADAP